MWLKVEFITSPECALKNCDLIFNLRGQFYELVFINVVKVLFYFPLHSMILASVQNLFEEREGEKNDGP